MKIWLSLSASILALVTPGAALAQPMQRAAAAQQAAHDQLFQLFKETDEASLKRNPLEALYRGDDRYADRLGDLYSDAHFQAEKAAAEHDLAALHLIPPDALSADDRIAYDVFEFQTKDMLRGLQPDLLPLSEALPMNHFYGLQTEYPTLAGGQGGAPYKSVADYENSLKRNNDFAANIDEAIRQWKKGEAGGVVDSKLTVRNMIEQVNNQLREKPEESPYWGPIANFPVAIGAADRTRLTEAYRQSIATVVYPALQRLRDFLTNEYLGHARDGIGELYMKGGDALYRYQVQSTTTLSMTPDQIHQLGLNEVARITKEFDKVRAQIGFKSDLYAFFDYMRTDPKFHPKTRQQFANDFYAIKRKVDAKVPQYFAKIPQAPLVIRPYPTYREKFEARGSYVVGTADGSRPGTFYFNAYDLPARFTWNETTLFLHEGEPGHHFQHSLAQSNQALPNFMRFGGNTAYVEGWALYAETLGYDMVSTKTRTSASAR